VTRWRTALLSVALFVATIVVGWFVLAWVRNGSEQGARPRGPEVALAEASRLAPGKQVAVRGFVFVDSHVGTLLCSRRTRASRPACKGDVVTLRGLDTARLAMKQSKQAEGGYDAWSDGPVSLLATSVGASTLVVKDVLPG
jgi:hypothetical protein